MFGIGTPELMVIGLVLLMLYGPDRLPKMLAKVTGFMRDIKNAGQDVTRSVQNELYKIETQVQTLELDEQAQPRTATKKPEVSESVEIEESAQSTTAPENHNPVKIEKPEEPKS